MNDSEIVGVDISFNAQQAFEELEDIEASLHSSDAGRVLLENLGLSFAPRVSNTTLWGND